MGPVIAALAFTGIGAAPVAAQDAVRIEAGLEAPAWTRPGVDGRPVRFPQDSAGKPAVMLFWATWCPYCRALMPYLQAIREEYRAQGVQVFAVNIKEDGDPVAHMRELGFDFVVALEGDPVAASYGVRYTPGLFVIDGSGQVTYRRKPTEAKPGKTIAEIWSGQVRDQLEAALAASE